MPDHCKCGRKLSTTRIKAIQERLEIIRELRFNLATTVGLAAHQQTITELSALAAEAAELRDELSHHHYHP